MAQRDEALVKILERLAGEMTQQDKLLEDLLERQDALAKITESAGLHLRGGQVDTQQSYDKLFDTVSRYRSDMLKLVNEQDRINKKIADLENVLKITTYSVDVSNKRLSDLNECLSRLEKSSYDHYEYASKQPDAYRVALDSSARSFAALHAATEKHFSQLHKETERKLEIFQHETLRRLLLLDGIITSLQLLIARTEPPKKRVNWFYRTIHKLRSLFNDSAAS